MGKQRKDTPKRPRRQWKPAEIAVILTALGTFLTGLAASVASAEDRPKYVPGRYIIQLKPGTDSSAINAHHEAVRRLASRRAPAVDAAPKQPNVFEKRDSVCASIVTITATATVTENAPAAPTTPGTIPTPGADIN